MRKADSEQVARNIALLIWDKEKKVEQLNKVQGITMNCTSDDHINVICELHQNNIVRYLIEGTRSGMTVTANATTREMLRLPRGSQASHKAECSMWCSDIQKYMKMWADDMRFHKSEGKMRAVEMMKRAIKDSDLNGWKWKADKNGLSWEYCDVRFELSIEKGEGSTAVKFEDEDADVHATVFVIPEKDSALMDIYHDFETDMEAAIYWAARKIIAKANYLY